MVHSGITDVLGYISQQNTQLAEELPKTCMRLRIKKQNKNRLSGLSITDRCLLCVAAPFRWPWKSVWMNVWRPWIFSSTTISVRAWRSCGQGNETTPHPRGFPWFTGWVSALLCWMVPCRHCYGSRHRLHSLSFTCSVFWVSGDTISSSIVCWYTLQCVPGPQKPNVANFWWLLEYCWILVTVLLFSQ